MKKIFSLFLVAVLGASLFAASFKKGQTVYVSKNGNATEAEKSSKVVSAVTRGDSGIVVESTSKRSKVKFADLGFTGWVDNSTLTKKKVLKEAVTTSVDNIALAGKGKASSTIKEEATEEKKEEAKPEEPKPEENTSK